MPEVRRKKQLVQKVITVPENLVRGCEEFNAGLFYECHESFEEIWQDEQGPVRDLYKGLIQLAAAFVHISRGNHTGTERLTRTALGYLAPYRSAGAMGFDVEGICSDAEDVYRRVAQLGPEGISEFEIARRPVFTVDLDALKRDAPRWNAWGFDATGNALPMTIIVAE